MNLISFLNLFTPSRTHADILLFTCSFTHSLSHSPSPTHPLAHSLAHPHTHTHPSYHSPSHLLIHFPGRGLQGDGTAGGRGHAERLLGHQRRYSSTNNRSNPPTLRSNFYPNPPTQRTTPNLTHTLLNASTCMLPLALKEVVPIPLTLTLPSSHTLHYVFCFVCAVLYSIRC